MHTPHNHHYTHTHIQTPLHTHIQTPLHTHIQTPLHTHHTTTTTYTHTTLAAVLQDADCPSFLPRFQIASALSKELCALFFGINTFLATILKTLITLVVSDKRGLGLQVHEQVGPVVSVREERPPVSHQGVSALGLQGLPMPVQPEPSYRQVEVGRVALWAMLEHAGPVRMNGV